MKIAIVLLLFFSSPCNVTSEKQDCLNNDIRILMDDNTYKNIRIEFENKFQKWLDDSIKSVQYYNIGRWKLDEAVFLNTMKDAAILLLLYQDTSKNATMDDVQLVYAKNKNDKWYFYYKGMPTLSAQRYNSHKKDPTQPYTFEELSLLARKKIIEGGYYLNSSCKVNDEYVNGWFNESLERMNKEFR